MIVLFTDFGAQDPYVGQVKACLARHAPGEVVVDLLHQAPDYNAHAGAHLLAAFAPTFPPGAVFMCVVDPGVGTERDGVVVMAGGQWFVGPDNGLLSIVAARNRNVQMWRIHWQPETASTTFHGRDIFAVIAALIAKGEFPHDKLDDKAKLQVEFDPGELARIIYIDHFGNAWTGIRAIDIPLSSRVVAKGGEFQHSQTFGYVGKGEGFWFVNSVGLLELAINRGNAAEKLGLIVGDAVQVYKPN
ncbi:MAG: S-adenosyl-l-methionine hydroxide adenosyltransferase family protein [Thiobacillaceae bacterium]